MSLTDIKEWDETIANLLDLKCIFLVGIFEFHESTTRINIVAGIDSNLLDNLSCYIGNCSIEVDIGNKRHFVPIAMNACFNLPERKSLFLALCRQTNDVRTSIYDAFDLGHRCLDIVGVRVGHRLHPDWVLAANDHITHATFGGFPSIIVVHISYTYNHT